MTWKTWLAATVLTVSLAISVVYIVLIGPAWLRARRAGVQVGLQQALGMRLRGRRAARVLDAAARCMSAGMRVPLDDLEIHTLAGGDIDAIADAIILAKQRGMAVEWGGLVACDLAGRDVVAIVRAGVDPSKVPGAKEYAGRFSKAPRPPR